MDSISKLLGDKNFNQPPVIDGLKKFIRDNYSTEAVVSLSGKNIVISVNSASLAGSLRLRLPEIKRSLKIDGNLSLRIH